MTESWNESHIQTWQRKLTTGCDTRKSGNLRTL